MKDSGIKLIVVLGPTASGKSALGIALAQRFHGEIVSADSRQVYRGLDIGTAKVTAEERALVPHHLLDVADVQEIYTVSQFQQQAIAAINDIAARGLQPFLVGGSPHYIQAVVDNLDIPAVPPNPRCAQSLRPGRWQNCWRNWRNWIRKARLLSTATIAVASFVPWRCA